MTDTTVLWAAGKDGEVNFWWWWLHNYSNEVTGPLDPDVDLAVAASTAVPVRILDTGCGPVSQMGDTSQNQKPLEFTYCDPYAADYAQLWVRLEKPQPHAILPHCSEELSAVFGENTFDIAFARNTLDHGYDPAKACQELVRVVKPGGTVVLKHSLRAKTINGASGLHQWDLYEQDGTLMLEGYGNTVNITKLLYNTSMIRLAVVAYPPAGEQWIEAVFRKLP